MNGGVRIGTSGWQYDDWAGPFYPHGLRRADWLAWYAERFPTVEVNNTFYRLPDSSVFARWARETPAGFVIAPKVSQYLSHRKRLREPAEPVERYASRARHLGDRLGPSLLQLPPTFRRDDQRLADLLAVWPRDLRLAVELRHDSWFADEVFATLHDHGVALCLADRGSRVVGPVVATADWGYVRLHAGRASPRPCYGRAALRTWRDRIEACWGPGQDVFVFFNNDHRACAVRDARTLARLMGVAGWGAGGGRQDAGWGAGGGRQDAVPVRIGTAASG